MILTLLSLPFECLVIPVKAKRDVRAHRSCVTKEQRILLHNIGWDNKTGGGEQRREKTREGDTSSKKERGTWFFFPVSEDDYDNSVTTQSQSVIPFKRIGKHLPQNLVFLQKGKTSNKSFLDPLFERAREEWSLIRSFWSKSGSKSSSSFLPSQTFAFGFPNPYTGASTERRQT